MNSARQGLSTGTVYLVFRSFTFKNLSLYYTQTSGRWSSLGGSEGTYPKVARQACQWSGNAAGAIVMRELLESF
jgi:hypothetical protein